MISQKKILDMIKERIRIWNITFLITSSLIFVYMVLSAYLGYSNSKYSITLFTILLMLFSLPLGISLGLNISARLVKEYIEEG